ATRAREAYFPGMRRSSPVVAVAVFVTIASAAPSEERKIRWATGAVAEVTHYANGVRDGESIRYYQDGTVAVRAHYKAGLLDGPFEEDDVYGKPMRRGAYVAGREDGEWLELGKTGHYDHGMRTGPWVDDKGAPVALDADGQAGKRRLGRREGAWS